MRLRNSTPRRAAGLSAAAPERERDPRARIEIVGTVRVGDERLPARICDLSSQGFGATSVRPLPIGSMVMISLPMVGEVRAQVRWALGGTFGAHFLDPIDVAELLPARPTLQQS
jgi:hypothetical protein